MDLNLRFKSLPRCCCAEACLFFTGHPICVPVLWIRFQRLCAMLKNSVEKEGKLSGGGGVIPYSRESLLSMEEVLRDRFSPCVCMFMNMTDVFWRAACCPESARPAASSHSASMTFTAGRSVLAVAALLNTLALTYKRSQKSSAQGALEGSAPLVGKSLTWDVHRAERIFTILKKKRLPGMREETLPGGFE